MRTNRDTKQYPGGILNRINHITMRDGGNVKCYQDLTANQNTGAHLLIARTAAEMPDARTDQNGVKENDV